MSRSSGGVRGSRALRQLSRPGGARSLNDLASIAAEASAKGDDLLKRVSKLRRVAKGQKRQTKVNRQKYDWLEEHRRMLAQAAALEKDIDACVARVAAAPTTRRGARARVRRQVAAACQHSDTQEAGDRRDSDVDGGTESPPSVGVGGVGCVGCVSVCVCFDAPPCDSPPCAPTPPGSAQQRRRRREQMAAARATLAMLEGDGESPSTPTAVRAAPTTVAAWGEGGAAAAVAAEADVVEVARVEVGVREKAGVEADACVGATEPQTTPRTGGDDRLIMDEVYREIIMGELVRADAVIEGRCDGQAGDTANPLSSPAFRRGAAVMKEALHTHSSLVKELVGVREKVDVAKELVSRAVSTGIQGARRRQSATLHEEEELDDHTHSTREAGASPHSPPLPPAPQSLPSPALPQSPQSLQSPQPPSRPPPPLPPGASIEGSAKGDGWAKAAGAAGERDVVLAWMPKTAESLWQHVLQHPPSSSTSSSSSSRVIEGLGGTEETEETRIHPSPPSPPSPPSLRPLHVSPLLLPPPPPSGGT